MKINQVIIAEDKQRLDPSCWKGYHKAGTKMKGDTRVNNCVPNESVEEGMEEDSLNEFAPTNNPNGGNYLKALASAWYNGTFNTGDLHKGIKSQEDVERILERGIHCGDGKIRKYYIGYNADFDGVEIQSDDHYEYADYDAAGRDIDSRTGKPWGPYDVVAFGDNELDESVNEDWNKVNHHDKTDGMSSKAVKAYRRENPGSKLKTAVTTKPSKLKAGSKDAKRRKSFCARMSGNKGPMKDEHGKPTPKAKALSRWNCESIEQLEELAMIAEQKVSEARNMAQQAAIAIAKKKKQGVAEATDQWYIVMRGNLDFHGKYHGKGDDVTGPLSKLQADAELHKTHPYDTNWAIVPASSMQKPMYEHDDRSSPQIVAAKKALSAGLKKMPGSSPNMLQQLIHKIEPDGTIMVVNSSHTNTMNNIKKILALGGGKQFDVVMAPPGPGWHSTRPVAVPDEKKEVAEGTQGEQSAYLQGAKDIIKGADPMHIARVRNLDPDTLQRYVNLVWDKIDSKEYNYRKPDLAEVKDEDDDGLIGGLYTPEQWAKMLASLKKKAQEQDAKKQEQPKDLGESTDELNKLIKLSGNTK